MSPARHALRKLDCNTSVSSTVVDPLPGPGTSVFDACYVSAKKHLILSFREKGLVLLKFNDKGFVEYVVDTGLLEPGHKLKCPSGIATAQCGLIFLSEWKDEGVHVYAPDGKYRQSVTTFDQIKLGHIWRLEWLDKCSALALVHVGEDKTHHLDIVRVDGLC